MICHVTAYPFATTEETIEVPDDTKDIEAYVYEHMDEVKFREPDLDYCGAEFSWSKKEARKC